MNILIATEKPFAKDAIEGIKKVINNTEHKLFLLEKYTEKTELINAVADVDALIVRSDLVDKDVLNAAKKLKIVVRAGAGYDNVNTNYAKELGIVVENTPGQNANAVAELVLGLLVYMERNAYNGTSGSELKNKKLGILAFGNVGRNVARIAKGFSMDVYAYDAFCSKEQIEAEGVKVVPSQDSLFETCDIVSLHIPATPNTKESINKTLVNKMPQNGILINTARKEVINEEEILQLLKERTDLKFITDIKPNLHNAFLGLESRYFSTPKKMGAQTKEANTNAGIAAAKQIISFFKNGDTTFQVNK